MIEQRGKKFKHTAVNTLESPLADRLRPKSLDEILGQEQLTGPEGILRKAVENGNLLSFILWGPPGCGKTTLARAMAHTAKAHFVEFSAVTSGIAEVRKTIEEAKKLKNFATPTILFIDEIHRFNKAQQDAFLPYVEDGTIVLIGATTENPFFEVISPLLSRLKIFQLQPLSFEILEQLLQKAESSLRMSVEKSGRELLFSYAAGDGRRLLNAVEAAHFIYPESTTLSAEQIKKSLEKNIIVYDKSGDYHYDTISAFIKSVRGSNPDAALHWLSRMLQAGEDPKFIARRLVILSSEDIGNADPQALVIATAAAQSVAFVGMPEARLILAQATTYLASAPKSNASYLALQAALSDVEAGNLPPVPLHLRNAPAAGMKQFGMSIGYRYPHSFPEHFIPQNYFPEGWENKIYYEPSEQGLEREIKTRVEKWRKAKHE